jgi:hypothetical protein
MKYHLIALLVLALLLTGSEAKKNKDSRPEKAERAERVESEEELTEVPVKESKEPVQAKKAIESKEYKEYKEKDKGSKDSKDDGFYVKRCPIGWYRYKQEKCFKMYTDAPQSQAEAEATCQATGATLASVQSENERQFLKSLALKDMEEEAATRVWIGLKRKANLWYWFDLSPVQTLTWFEGHPTSAPAESKCVSLAMDQTTLVNNSANFGKFFADDCTSPLGFVCQKYILDHCKICPMNHS